LSFYRAAPRQKEIGSIFYPLPYRPLQSQRCYKLHFLFCLLFARQHENRLLPRRPRRLRQSAKIAKFARYARYALRACLDPLEPDDIPRSPTNRRGIWHTPSSLKFLFFSALSNLQVPPRALFFFL